ncbi:hypothetical protein SESBI_50314 [Sesbania bispinosa]|nr:hypothetical protein SESBI_50314 [Sesbania bispinosa]
MHPPQPYQPPGPPLPSLPSISKSTQLAKKSLVGRILSPKPLNRGAVKNILAKAWEDIGDFQITDMGSNMFLFSFSDKKEVIQILRKGPLDILLDSNPWTPAGGHDNHNKKLQPCGGRANILTWWGSGDKLDSKGVPGRQDQKIGSQPNDSVQGGYPKVQERKTEREAKEDPENIPKYYVEFPEDEVQDESNNLSRMTIQPEEESNLIVGWNNSLSLKRLRDDNSAKDDDSLSATDSNQGSKKLKSIPWKTGGAIEGSLGEILSFLASNNWALWWPDTVLEKSSGCSNHQVHPQLHSHRSVQQYRPKSLVGNLCDGNPRSRERRNLWPSLGSLQLNPQNPWCILGDFNELLSLSEKQGLHPPNSQVQRRDRNKLFRLRDDTGQWREGQQNMECMVLDYFKQMFKAEGDSSFQESAFVGGRLIQDNLVIAQEVAKDKGELLGLTLAPTSPPLTHLLFADEVVLFAKAESQEILQVEWSSPGRYIGLPANWGKSKVSSLSWLKEKILQKIEG